ncbi:amino acid permease, partial [Flavobacteriales bacterium]|nr:amino acid permease [Flavobacteriales bacterium]
MAELIALALGGMVGGGIFSILGISVEKIGNATPIAILIGGVLAMFSAYSYVKLALLYKDEGATYSFFKKTFPNSHFASSAIGWLVVFGYISTLALYAFTFSTYLSSVLPFQNSIWINRAIAGAIILLFSIINLVSVKGMG